MSPSRTKSLRASVSQRLQRLSRRFSQAPEQLADIQEEPAGEESHAQDAWEGVRGIHTETTIEQYSERAQETANAEAQSNVTNKTSSHHPQLATDPHNNTPQQDLHFLTSALSNNDNNNDEESPLSQPLSIPNPQRTPHRSPLLLRRPSRHIYTVHYTDATNPLTPFSAGTFLSRSAAIARAWRVWGTQAYDRWCGGGPRVRWQFPRGGGGVVLELVDQEGDVHARVWVGRDVVEDDDDDDDDGGGDGWEAGRRRRRAWSF